MSEKARHADITTKIEQSSLGTAAAKRARARTSTDAAAKIMSKANEIAHSGRSTRGLIDRSAPST